MLGKPAVDLRGGGDADDVLTGAALSAGGDDSGRGGSEGERIAAEERKFHDAALFDYFSEAGGLRFELYSRGGYIENLGYSAHFEGDVDGGGEADGETKTGDARGAKAGLFGVNVVLAGRQGRQVEKASGVGGGAGDNICFEVANRDRHGGNDGTRGVGNDSGDGSSFALG